MLGRVILFLVFLVSTIVATAKAISNLRDGIGGGYIQRGMLFATLFLMAIPMLFLDLKPPVGLWVIIALEVVYMTFYTRMYFKIKEERKNDKKEALFDCLSGISLMVAVIAACSIDDELIRQLSIVMCIVIYLAIYYLVEKIRKK